MKTEAEVHELISQIGATISAVEALGLTEEQMAVVRAHHAKLTEGRDELAVRWKCLFPHTDKTISPLSVGGDK